MIKQANQQSSDHSTTTPEQPLVSIIVTVYNGDKYLADQLDSIINQTHKNLEIIICDDASTDGSRQIINEYAGRDKRITPIFHHQNIGLHINLETGFQVAKGVYIAISDQDDIWKHEKIELLLKNIGNNLAIFSDSALIDGTGQSLHKTLMGSLKIKDRQNCCTLPSLLKQNVASGHAMLFCKPLLAIALPLQKNIIFDHQLALASAAYGGLVYFPEPLVLHRIHATNSVNGGLINKELRHKTKKHSPTEEKYFRATKMLEKFSFILEIPNRHKISPLIQSLEANHVLFDRLGSIVFELKKFDEVFFNFTLLFLLLRLREQYPGYEIFRLRRCISLSKGARWYGFFAKFRKRAASSAG